MLLLLMKWGDNIMGRERSGEKNERVRRVLWKREKCAGGWKASQAARLIRNASKWRREQLQIFVYTLGWRTAPAPRSCRSHLLYVCIYLHWHVANRNDYDDYAPALCKSPCIRCGFWRATFDSIRRWMVWEVGWTFARTLRFVRYNSAANNTIEWTSKGFFFLSIYTHI